MDLTSVSAASDLNAELIFLLAGWDNDFDFQAMIDDVTIRTAGVEIPEPITASALAAALCGLGGYIRRRRRK